MNRINKNKVLDGALLAGVIDTSGASGTWSTSVSSDVVSLNKSSAADDNDITIPISSLLEDVNDEDYGVRVKGITINYTIGTNAVGTMTAELHKVTLASDGTASATTTSFSESLETTVGDHQVSLTVDNDNGYLEADYESLINMELIVNANATDVYTVDIYGIVVNYEVVEL